ncbi:hypothetical protein HYW43_01230 [Candidatus Daviesbacteria bacterium]|nr:hypothetical protein [Candidatus Daviesbacteria bacterium]
MSADFFGYTATSLNLIMLIPQVAQTWKTKQTKDLSLTTLTIFSIACLLWVIYGVIKSAIPVILANTVVGALNLTLIFLKFKYRS